MAMISYWLMWTSLGVGVVCFVLGFLLLRTVNRAFFKAAFYGSLAAAVVFGFIWFFSRPPPAV